MTYQAGNKVIGASDDCYEPGGILERLDQLRALVLGVVRPRADSMVLYCGNRLLPGHRQRLFAVRLLRVGRCLSEQRRGNRTRLIFKNHKRDRRDQQS